MFRIVLVCLLFALELTAQSTGAATVVGTPYATWELISSPPDKQTQRAPTTFPQMRMPYVNMWPGGFQRQLSKTWVGEVLYQSSSGVGLLKNWDMNVVPLNISTDPAVLNQVFNAVQNYKPYTQAPFSTFQTTATTPTIRAPSAWSGDMPKA